VIPPIELCGRCGRELYFKAEVEQCIWCEGPLCMECWDATGSCGEPGAEQFQRETKEARTEAERRAIMARLPPIGMSKRRLTKATRSAAL
jgi:hypothetical protein